MRSSQRNDTSIVSVKAGAYTTKASHSTKMNSELRELKLYCDQLYKEIERKDSRNDALMKELQAIRVANSNTEV